MTHRPAAVLNPRGGTVDTHTTPAPAVPGYIADKAEQLVRLRRIEGQVRGLQRMVEADTYCIDILTQVAAVTKALESVALRLLDAHLHHCMTRAAQDEEECLDDKVAEASAAIARLVGA